MTIYSIVTNYISNKNKVYTFPWLYPLFPNKMTVDRAPSGEIIASAVMTVGE